MKVKFEKRCPYCGRTFKTTFNSIAYCKRCIDAGFNWLHMSLGKTNGWDKGKKGASGK